MAAVRDLLTGAFRLIGVVDPSEALDGQSAKDGLQVLNELIESLNLEHLLNPTGVNRLDVTTTAGQAMHTIGAGGNFDTTRPVAIDKAFVTVGTGEYPVQVVDDNEWAALPIKNIQGIPTKLYYEPEYPLGKVYLWPKPSQAFNLVLWVWDRIPTFTTVNDTLSLPPGYARMLRYNLAVELAIEWGRAVRPEVAQIAMDSKAAIKRVNEIVPLLGVDEALMQGSTGSGTNMASFLAGD